MRKEARAVVICRTYGRLRFVFLLCKLPGCSWAVHHLRRCGTREGWRRGVVVSGVRRMNEVNARQARLVPGWVTVFGRVYHFGM